MKPSWRKLLHSILAKHASEQSIRLAVVGIGNDLQGDDAAGALAARLLLKAALPESVLIVEGGLAPEAYSGLLRRFMPEAVILIDAADMGEKPGVIIISGVSSAEGWTGNTHMMPPTVFADYLMKETGCTVDILAIQPLSIEFGSGVSLPVRRAVNRIVREFKLHYC